jgi:hypothetical protein
LQHYVHNGLERLAACAKASSSPLDGLKML